MSARCNGQGGAALLLVVWVVALLSLLAATALQITSASGHIAQAALERARMQAAADGAVNLALLEMIDPEPNSPWPVDGTLRTMEVSGYRIGISARDEAGRLDVNRAPLPMLKGLFVAASPSGDAAAWVKALGRYRGDGVTTSDGEAGAAGTPVAVFRNMDEVAAVAGLPEAVYRCLRPDLTVYTGMDSVDRRYASAQLRRVLAKAGGEAADGSGLAQAQAAQSYAGRVFGVAAEVKGPTEGSGFRREVVIRVTGDPERPVLVAAWESDEESGMASLECP